MFNTEFDGATNKVGVLDAVGTNRTLPEIQYLGWPLSSPKRPRKSLRSLLLRITGTFTPTAFRTATPSLRRAETTAWFTGVTSRRRMKVVWRWIRRRYRRLEIQTSSAQLEFRSISGIRKEATT